MRMIDAVLIVEKDGVRWFSMETPTKIKQGYRIKCPIREVSIKGLVESKDLTCTCAAYRVRGKGSCVHIDALQKMYFRWVGNVPMADGDVGIFSGGEFQIIPPPKVGVNAYQILNAMDSTTEDVLDLGEEAIEIRSYSRLSGELQESFSRSLSLTSSAITSLIIEGGTLVTLEGFIARFSKVALGEPFGADFPTKTLEELAKETEKVEKPVGATEKKEKTEKKTPVVKGAWVDVPKPSDFYVEDEVWEALLWIIASGGTALLLGPTGCGKTELVMRASKAMGVPFEPFNFGAMSEPRISLIGATHFHKDTGTLFNQSRFIASIQKEQVVILMDELTRANRDASNLIYPLLDGQGYMSLDESEDARIIYRGKGVSFIGTANVGYEYTGTDALDRALLDRMCFKFHLTYPTAAVESDIIFKRYPSCSKDIVKKITETAMQQRSMANEGGDFETAISTRMILDCAKALSDGMDPHVAVRFAIVNCFPKEGGVSSEQTKMLQLFQKRAPELVARSERK